MLQLVVWVGLQILSSLLFAPKTQSTMKPGEVEGTTVDVSSPVPVLFGTRLMSNANCVWYGDIEAKPIKKKGGKK